MTDGAVLISNQRCAKKTGMKSRPADIQTYRDVLRREFLQRSAKNTRYSMRSFSKTLDVSHSFLSQVMSGKRRLSPTMAHRISKKLGFSGAEQGDFVELAQIELAVDLELKDLLSKRKTKLVANKRFREFGKEEFALIADWYHFAILELAKCEPGGISVAKISDRLALSENSVHAALVRLKSLGMMMERDRAWSLGVDPTESYGTNSDLTKAERSAAIKRFHRSHLAMAQNAILKQDLDERDFSGMTIAMHPSQVPMVKELIRAFFQDLERKLSAGPAPTDVYQVAAQLYRLTDPNSKGLK